MTDPHHPYRVQLVESPTGFPRMLIDLWVLRKQHDGTMHVLRPGGLFEPTPPNGTVWDIEPTLQLPVDTMQPLWEELTRILTGRGMTAVGADQARADELADALEVERARVDRVLSALLPARPDLPPPPPA